MLKIQIDEDTSPWDIDEYVAVLKKLSKVRLKAYEEMCEEEKAIEAPPQQDPPKEKKQD